VTKKRERSPLEAALGFRIEIRKAEELEHRSGSLIWTKDDGTTKAVRPCTIAEIQMWEHLNATLVIVDVEVKEV